ncbi:cell division protein FtsK [Streptacidiphilus rugosus]|uniref:cell division protein FtsK n=1 Tax=Streptacidiphilus rugosus TaxID=405783 RepID=UPI000563A0D4|nr:cell division protein FtsK [Streptacidiphilus rugosus]
MNHDPIDNEGERELFARLEADLTSTDTPTSAPTRYTTPLDVVTETDEDGPSVYVDAPAPADPSLLEKVKAERLRPIIPGWLRSAAEFKTAAGWLARHVGHTAGFHAVRAPLYAAVLAGRSPRGMARAARWVGRWVTDAEAQPLRLSAVHDEDARLYLDLLRRRDGRVVWRRWTLGVAAVLALVAALVVWGLTPGLVHLAVAGALVTVFGVIGAPADKPLISRAVTRPTVQRLTSEVVEKALAVLGIAEIGRALGKGGRIVFTAPITRDGPGWRADVELPHGVTVTEVMDKRDKLASGLRRPLGCVWPEPMPGEHPGHMLLWVGDQDMNKAKQPTWPLMTSGTVDLFKPAAFSTDQRGRWVSITLMYIAGVIGAIPRMGKTFLLRLLLLIAALDPRAELHTYDLKGTGDLDAVGDAVSVRHRAGEEEEDIEHAVADMRAVQQELRRRAKVIRALPDDLCPESKVTSALASNPTLGLHPIVIGVDECQKWFEHPKHGAELEEICTDLVKRGPATGIVLLLATQRPDAKSLPTGIGANAVARWCMKVLDHTANDMVLGTSAHKNGIRATTFAWADKGICYFVGEGADARIVRTVEVDVPKARAIAARGRAARLRAGTLAGYAAGIDTVTETAPAYDLLADVLAVVPDSEAKAWSETVTARLAVLRPDVYGGWAPDQLAAALKPHGINTGQVWLTPEGGKGANRRGIIRADIAGAVTLRDKERGK